MSEKATAVVIQDKMLKQAQIVLDGALPWQYG